MKLNTLLKTLGFLALAATPVVAGTAPAPKGPAPVAPVNDDLGINVGLGYHTNYIWRGFNFGQHWLSGGLNGAIPLVGGAGEDGAGTRLAWDVEYGTLLGDQDHVGANLPPFITNDLSFQRVQLGAAIQHDVGPVTLSLGYRYFRNMGGVATGGLFGPFTGGGMQDGQEVSVGLATALGPVNVATSANYDYVNDSWYFDLDLNTNIAITDAISVVPFFNVGYGHNMNWQFNEAQWSANPVGGLAPLGFNNGGNPDLTGWTAITTGLRFPIKLNSRATLTPYIAGNFPLGPLNNAAGSARAAITPAGGLPDTALKSVLFGGVTLSVRF